MNHISPRHSTVLVMHEDQLLCAGLVTALRQHSTFDVCQVPFGALAVDLPDVDVIIADYPNAVRLCDPNIRATWRPAAAARILAFTSNDREADIRRAIEAGVHGYILGGGPLSELIEGVTTVAGGARFLCRSVAQRMADNLARAALTARETDVLRLVVSGESNKAIARKLDIEVGTVKSHMSAIMAKLGASSRTQAAGIAASRGLIGELSPERLSRPVFFSATLESRAQLA